MSTDALEFRLRYLTHGLVFLLGFWAPWDRFLHLDGVLGSGQSTWLALASLLAHLAGLSFTTATLVLLIGGICCAFAAALLRTWGSAYLGASLVKDGVMHANALVCEGPYRWIRNPLYLGTWLHSLALALLMPPTGAIFCIVAIGLLQVRLIAGEERFLARSRGSSYQAYRASVPRVLPSFRTRVTKTEVHPHWPLAIAGESYMIGVALCFAIAGWRYNAFLLTQCVVVTLGISLIVGALLPALKRQTQVGPATLDR